MPDEPRRRWFRFAFGLRTLFVVVTLARRPTRHLSRQTMRHSMRIPLVFTVIGVLAILAFGKAAAACTKQCHVGSRHSLFGRCRQNNCNNVIRRVARPAESATTHSRVYSDAAKQRQESPVAVVLGKPVFANDIHVDENDHTASRNYTAIAPHIFGPLIAKYVAANRINATTDEIDAYKERLPANDEIASAAIVRWRFNRALLDEYGGKVIWQQFGWEPIDAYRNWLKGEEKAGSFKILQPELSDAFWKGLKAEHGIQLDDDTEAMKLLKIPPWHPAPRP